VIVNNFIRVENDELTQRQWRKLFKDLTFINDNGEVVECYRQLITRGYTKLPRGAWSLLPGSVRYHDQRAFPKGKQFHFNVKLDDISKDERFRGQSDAVEAMFSEEQGIIIRPPGTGKTQIALAFLARAGTRSLVIVHTEDIMNQWIEYAHEAVPDARIGVIRGKRYEIGDITIGTVQTLRRYMHSHDKRFWAQFGCVILDEAHHAAAASFEQVLNSCPAKYRFGFTASETRADGMHPSMKFIIGPVIHKQKFSSPVKLTVVPIRTKLNFMYRGAFDWSTLLDTLISDDKRNRQIAEVVDNEINSGNSILVLSRRIEHLERIGSFVESDSIEILTSKRRSKDRKRILKEFREGDIKCLLATQLADEALDVPRLNRVALTHPGKHEGRIIQQIGRAIRKYPEKQDAIIYDFVDWKIRVLRRQWSERKRTYRKNNIWIQLRRKKWHSREQSMANTS
jgi:superfamily II DNA or RNA helicase